MSELYKKGDAVVVTNNYFKPKTKCTVISDQEHSGMVWVKPDNDKNILNPWKKITCQEFCCTQGCVRSE